VSVLQNANASAPRQRCALAPSPGSFRLCEVPHSSRWRECGFRSLRRHWASYRKWKAADTNHPLMYSGMIPSVCPFPRHDSFQYESSLHFRQFCGFGTPSAPSPISNGTCPTRRSRPFCFRTTLINHRAHWLFPVVPSAMLSRISIARFSSGVLTTHCRVHRLVGPSLARTALQFLPESEDDVPGFSYSSSHVGAARIQAEL